MEHRIPDLTFVFNILLKFFSDHFLFVRNFHDLTFLPPLANGKILGKLTKFRHKSSRELYHPNNSLTSWGVKFGKRRNPKFVSLEYKIPPKLKNTDAEKKPKMQLLRPTIDAKVPVSNRQTKSRLGYDQKCHKLTVLRRIFGVNRHFFGSTTLHETSPAYAVDTDLKIQPYKPQRASKFRSILRAAGSSMAQK